MRRHPTVRQVAAAAGVSPATVSNALNGTGRLSEETRARVLTEIDRLGYRPSTTARAAARGQTGIIGLTFTTYGPHAMDYTQNPYHAELALGAIAEAHRRGFLLVVLPDSTSSWVWMTTPLDGVIHCEPRATDPVLAVLHKRDIPLVTVGAIIEGTDASEPGVGRPYVDTDHATAISLVLDHLLESGSRRPAILLPEHDDAYPLVVRRAVESWSERSGVSVRTGTFPVFPGYPDTERAAAHALLRERPRPDALVGLYDPSAENILAVASELGIPVPGRLKVVGFSEGHTYALTTPPVTTVDWGARVLGEQAVDMLLALVDGRRLRRPYRLVRPTLHVRRSTGSRVAIS